jgi:hypothetical protein
MIPWLVSQLIMNDLCAFLKNAVCCRILALEI